MFRFLRAKSPGAQVSGSHSFFIHRAHWWRSDEVTHTESMPHFNTEEGQTCILSFHSTFGHLSPSHPSMQPYGFISDTEEICEYDLTCFAGVFKDVRLHVQQKMVKLGVQPIVKFFMFAHCCLKRSTGYQIG